MGRIQQYLEVVPLWILIPAVLIGCFGFILTPSRLRLPLALMILPGWLILSFMNELGTVQQIAKASSPAAYLFLAIASFMHPGNNRPIPWALWLFPFIGLLSIAYVLGTLDRDVAVILRLQWVLLTFAAIGLARVAADHESLSMSLRYLTIGSLFAVALIFSAIATNPAAAFARGLGRFFPHGANPNHVGPVFMLAAPLFLFAIIRWPRTFWKVVFIAALAATIGMAVMTASRQTIVVMAGVCMPLALYLTRRPVATIVAGGVLLAGVMFVLSTSPEITYERLLTLETGRAGLARTYTEIVQNRPVFGLMGTSGLSAIQADDVGQHTHNAYVDMLYLGGLSYALPMLALFAAGLFSAWRVFRIRKWLWFDPLMLSMLAAFYGMMLLHGLVGVFITYPTHAWAFFFVFLCCFFITTATQARAVLAQPNYEDPAQEYENEAMDYPVAATFTR